ncbi:FAD-dependent oxidoreductase [Mycobacterium sp. 21AC1]|uniref:NAD(P)-binding protein n=1 Tax=[Mycobacterium] appelbergii TaxID=2939269 RepID=UPI002939434D|nr:NAD(P)-binding protein [Mycobacterium sp. 21AC1]MDV3125381.1 FAD-dependent oxidoreductase [Mycobacterium sp. 21AC1]
MTDEKRSSTTQLLDAPSDPQPTVAVVGSGPSGCYVATFLAKKWPQAEITVFESMPTPYGLVRYGIAADHQGTKNVTRQFDRLFTRDGVRFAGNVCVGTDIAFAELAPCFDIVVLATGLPQDRSLGIPQQAGTRVIGARTLLGALNGHPVQVFPRNPDGRYTALGQQLAVVGMGNVAIDVVRLMSKDPHELDGSDIDDELFEQLRPSRPSSIDVISRSGLSLAKFDLAMLRELLSLPNVDVAASGLTDDDNGPAAELLRPRISTVNDSFTPEGTRTQVRLHFQVTPESITCSGGRTLLRASTHHGPNGGTEIVVDSVITAIGFTQGAPEDRSCPTVEWSGDNVYRVGWLSRGPQGAIPENRKDARRVVDTITDDVESGRLKIGRAGFTAVESSLRNVVTFADWQRIEAFEQREAPPGRCRRKITDRKHMLSIASSAPDSADALRTAQSAGHTRAQQQPHRESDQ